MKDDVCLAEQPRRAHGEEVGRARPGADEVYGTHGLSAVAALVGVAEILEAGERLVRVLALAQLEGVEAAAFHEEQEVARDVADRAQLATVAAALAQQARERIAAAVAELREVHLDARHALQRDRGGIVRRLQAHHLLLK